MSSTTTIIIILILLFIGINMAANNSFISFILAHFFYSDATSKTSVRLLGIIVLSTIILMLLDYRYYALLINTMVIIIFTFLTIKGRNKVKSVLEQKRHEQAALHQVQLEHRKKELAKTRARKIRELEEMRRQPKSVKNMKNKMWNDGSLTQKELIRDLNKD